MANTSEPEGNEGQVVKITGRYSPSLRRRLRIAAATQDRDQQDILTEALTDWLDKHEF